MFLNTHFYIISVVLSLTVKLDLDWLRGCRCVVVRGRRKRWLSGDFINNFIGDDNLVTVVVVTDLRVTTAANSGQGLVIGIGLVKAVVIPDDVRGRLEARADAAVGCPPVQHGHLQSVLGSLSSIQRGARADSLLLY